RERSPAEPHSCGIIRTPEVGLCSYVVLLDPTNTQNGCRRSMLFLLYFFVCARAFIIATMTVDAGTAMLHAPCRQLASHKNRVYNEDGNSAEGGVSARKL